MARQTWYAATRAPVVRAVTLVILAATAAGILRGYAELGRRTVNRHAMEDFGLFYASGRQFLERGELYGPLLRPGSTRPSDARNLNPPHASLLFLPFAAVSPRLALGLWIALNLLALGDVVRIAMREIRIPVASLEAAAAAVFLLAWAPAAALVITGQLALLVAWPLTRAWRAARHGDWSRAGWWLGAAAALKVFLLVFVPYLALRRRWPALRRALLQLAIFVALGAVVFGPAAYVSWTAQFADVGWLGHYMNASVWGVLERVLHGFRPYAPLLPPMLLPGPRLATIAGSVVAVAILAATWWRVVQGGDEVDASFTLLTVAALLASPLGWVYYFWLPIAPATATVVAAAPESSLKQRAAAGLVGLCLLCHASATIWFQPSGLATLTVGSPYFWALAGTWLLLIRSPHVRDHADACG